MTITDALFEYLRAEIVPMIAGESELVGALLSGALRTGRKKVSGSFGNSELLKAMGLTGENGDIDADAFREFADGMFEQKDVIAVSLAELLKLATGIDSASPLLEDRIKITRSDADRFLSLLQQ